MMRPFFPLLALATVIVLGAGCSDSFGKLGASSRLSVTMTAAANSRNAPLPLTFDVPAQFTGKIVALNADGTTNTKFNGYVRVSVKPGSVVGLTGNGTSGRNVQLTNGVADGLGVGVVGAFGETHIWAEDIGYVPVDPDRQPPPQCANGIDDNNNGLIDFPADSGCAFANDDSEDGGDYITGASEAAYFILPRIADVRGYTLGGTATSFPNQQVQVNTGWSDDTLSFGFSTVVTRVSSEGFYLTDLADPRGDSSIFAFNFSAPPLMRVCDRVKSFGGTAADFFGFTEVNYPTWELEEWDPNKRDCLVPEPHVFQVFELATATTPNTPQLTNNIAALVRMLAHDTVTVHVSSHFGPGYPALPMLVPTSDATNCDLNNDGKVDFTTDPEKTCSNNCSADQDCTEYSNFKAENQVRLVIVDPDPDNGGTASIFADGSADPNFAPLLLKGKQIKSFTGTLIYFSGGAQYTIQARCPDDIVTDPAGTPMKSNTACVIARTMSDNNDGSN